MAVVAFCMVVSFTRPSLEYASLLTRGAITPFHVRLIFQPSDLKNSHMTGMSQFAQPRSQAAQSDSSHRMITNVILGAAGQTWAMALPSG
jgi:hypothetical protein